MALPWVSDKSEFGTEGMLQIIGKHAMMKKMCLKEGFSMQRFCFVICMALLLCLLFGCGAPAVPPTEPPTAAPTAPPTEPPVTEPPPSPGMDMLLTIYGAKDLSSPVDYKLINFLQLDGINYFIHWSSDVEESLVSIVNNEDGTATVNINELCSEDTPYTLTAKIATADGQWVTHQWECILPKALDPATVLAEAHSLEHGKRLSYSATLVGKVTSIIKNFDEDYESVTLTFRITDGNNEAVRCYGLTGQGIDTLEVGDVIAVTGYLQNYGSVVEFDSGCVLTGIITE